MKQISWDDFYDKFFDWSTSTQISRSYGLTEYGPPDEICEVVMEWTLTDAKYAQRFIKKALDAGVQFTPEQTLDFILDFDKPTLGRMALTAKQAFNRDQLEDIYSSISDDDFEKLSKKAGMDIFADEEDEDDDDEIEFEEDEIVEPVKIGFFTKLMAMIGLAEIGGSKHAHKGRCDGDCAHCPPHYGYRYGRWYYGHGHQYGCEFGGNKGDGAL